MTQVFVVGQMTVKHPEKWAEYRSQVLATLQAFGGELVFRGEQAHAFSGICPHPDIVVIRFACLADAEGWHGSAAYQALIPLRQEAADVVLTSYRS